MRLGPVVRIEPSIRQGRTSASVLKAPSSAAETKTSVEASMPRTNPSKAFFIVLPLSVLAFGASLERCCPTGTHVSVPPDLPTSGSHALDSAFVTGFHWPARTIDHCSFVKFAFCQPSSGPVMANINFEVPMSVRFPRDIRVNSRCFVNPCVARNWVCGSEFMAKSI